MAVRLTDPGTGRMGAAIAVQPAGARAEPTLGDGTAGRATALGRRLRAR